MAFRKAPNSIARALSERGYTDATPVQAAVLETEAEGRDLLVSAQTGSGKTVAYGIAIADALLDGADTMGPAHEPLALIIAPTRELALQVQRELNWLYQNAGARVIACVGGMDPGKERRQLSDGVHVVVGTPGRLRDHLERRALKVSALKAVVLDEADEMLDLGFREDLEFILETTPEERRTLLFSATLPKAIVTLARNYQRDAFRIQTIGETRGHADIEYRVMKVGHHMTESVIVNLLRFLDPPSALVFCSTRQSVRHLEATLLERGFAAVALSGELSQHERNHALQALRDGRARVCVATDVAARGIDLPNLGLVIHADLPQDAEVLQHRSGRTGRAGRKGVSILLVPNSRRRRAEEMLGRARVDFSWSDPPTAEDIRKLDQERLLQSAILTEPGTEDDLAMADALLAAHSSRDIAAAFVKMYRAQLPSPEDVSEPVDMRKPREQTHHKKDRRKRPDNADRHPRGDNADRPREKPKSSPREMANGVWFKLTVGRERNADPKWLLPEICRQGEITKRDIGAIRVYETETRFEVDPSVAVKFAENVAARAKGGVRIFPAPDGQPAAGDNAPPRREHRDADKHSPKPHGGKPHGRKPYNDKPHGGKPHGKPKHFTPHKGKPKRH
ncbi:MAG TPA: DEAD/DEAH box helicase [Rhizomicrobium sp.]|nr:DEAD/DEAH box helicase [Rhizomicrobium sp.]